MLTVLSSLLSNSTFRKGLIGIVLFILLIGLGSYTYHHIYNVGKQEGITEQTAIFNKQQDAAKALLAQEQAEADKERADLNNQISALKTTTTSLKQQLDKKSTITTQKVIEYAKTDSGSKSCFNNDDSGLRIINESFPNSN